MIFTELICELAQDSPLPPLLGVLDEEPTSGGLCVECGKALHGVDNFCAKCGARRVVKGPKVLPEGPPGFARSANLYPQPSPIGNLHFGTTDGGRDCVIYKLRTTVWRQISVSDISST